MTVSPPDPPPTLLSRLAEMPGGIRLPDVRLSGIRVTRAWRVAGLVAALIAAAPLLTMAGAALLEARAREDIARLQEQAAPRLAAVAERDGAREALAPLLRRPGIGGTLDQLAQALPNDAALTSARRDIAGVLSIEVATPDPDRLRDALRRAPATRGLRESGQRGGNGALIVSFAGVP